MIWVLDVERHLSAHDPEEEEEKSDAFNGLSPMASAHTATKIDVDDNLSRFRKQHNTRLAHCVFTNTIDGTHGEQREEKNGLPFVWVFSYRRVQV